MSEENNPEVGGIAVDRLRSLIERIERLEEEKAAIASDIRDIFAEAKSAGFDVKIMRAVIKLRKSLFSIALLLFNFIANPPYCFYKFWIFGFFM